MLNVAREVTEKFIDDLDGSAAAETVSFALDGTSYEIDLSKKNASAFRKALTATSARLDARAGRARRRDDVPRRRQATMRSRSATSILSSCANGPAPTVWQSHHVAGCRKPSWSNTRPQAAAEHRRLRAIGAIGAPHAQGADDTAG